MMFLSLLPRDEFVGIHQDSCETRPQCRVMDDLVRRVGVKSGDFSGELGLLHEQLLLFEEEVLQVLLFPGRGIPIEGQKKGLVESLVLTLFSSRNSTTDVSCTVEKRLIVEQR